MTARKKAPIDIRKIAATPFEAVVGAKGIGADRKEWAENAKADRVNAVIAGSVLAQAKSEIYDSFKDIVTAEGIGLLTELVDCLGTTSVRAKALAEACDVASARLLILLAKYEVDGVVARRPAAASPTGRI